MLPDALRTCALATHKKAHTPWAEFYAEAAQQLAARACLEPSDLALDYMAIVDRETNGRNIMGDGGNGHGLGQIDGRYHGAWLAAHQNGMEPRSNIAYGMSIYVGNLVAVRKAAAKMALPPSETTIRRVAMAGYNADLSRCIHILERTGDPDQVDAITTKGFSGLHDYGADVWRRRQEFALHMPAEFTPAA
jgi:hypothetical protein